MIPNAVEKRDILFGVKKVSANQLMAFAKGYEQQEMLNDAAEFYNQLKSEADLRRILITAETDGDVFLWLKVHRWLGDAHIDQNALGRCVATAEKSGKMRYALLGYQKLGNDKAAEAVRLQLKDDGDFQAIEEAQVFLSEYPEEISDSEGDQED